MRQESTVNIGDREIRVVSEVLVDPELLIVNTLRTAEDQVLKKQHVVVPAAVAREYAESGAKALASCLHTSHLRVVQQLLSTPSRATPPATESPSMDPAAGVLATVVLDASGDAVSRVGEEQVPGSWLRAAYLLRGLSDIVGDRMGYGPPRRVMAAGERVAVLVTHTDGRTTIRFVDPGELRTRPQATHDDPMVEAG